jgi:HSP20 family molecular chaperone IbpA
MRWEIPGPWPSLEEVARRFDELIHLRWSEATEPPADVFVLENEVRVEIDLPGVEEAHVRVWIEETTLMVEARRTLPPPGPGARAARLARSRGVLRRRISLPREFARSRVKVEMRHGVLHARVERKEER